jgi:NADH-quinone oxidoreductase subunit M
MLTPDQIRLLLPALLGLPILAALVLRLVDGPRARVVAVGFALAHLLLTVGIVFSGMTLVQDDPTLSFTIDRTKKKTERVMAPQFVPGDPLPGGNHSYSTTYDVLTFHGTDDAGNDVRIGAAQFFIGLDGLNIWLIALASFMMVPVILYSWDSIHDRAGGYYSWMFFLQAGVLGVFLSFDLLLFYVCFELTLIPLLFLIGGWGPGPNRRDAARKLFLFTLAGGLITLLGVAGIVLFVYAQTGGQNQPRLLTFSIPELADAIQLKLNQAATETTRETWRNAQTYLFLALAVGFAVKIPIVPLHSWLPSAYAEAPTGVTVMLSALLAKMGLFGLVRICLPLCPDAALSVGMPLLGVLGAIGILYGALCAYAQTDMRRLVAYSSVSHLGFCVLAIVTFTPAGIAGSVLHMVNHGLSTGALFLLVGMLIRRYGTAQIANYSGVWSRLPILTFFTIFIALATIGLPGLNNFVSEMLMLAGVFGASSGGWNTSMLTLAALAALGIFLSAWYTLTMIRRVYFGPDRLPPAIGPAADITPRERFAVGPIAILCLLLGLFAQPVLDVMYRDVSRLGQVGDNARARSAKQL